MKSASVILASILLPLTLSAQFNTAGTPWENENLDRVPEYRIVGEDSIRSIIFESLPYKGKDKAVFAYYSTPSMIAGKNYSGEKLPGIVLVHGGGGAAFREWVAMWAKRGYAALALDTRGNGHDRMHIEGGFDENGKETPYFDVTLPLNEQWVYQATGDVIKAHSLLRSFQEVDTARTAITGISWGGVLTCIASSLDNRFKAAVPVYGCGYLWESGKMKEQLDKLPALERATWISQYDPSNYLPLMDRPILFIDGTNDVHFYLPSMAQSADLPKQSEVLIKQGLRHSHKYGWQNDEIEMFINSRLLGSTPMPRITEETMTGSTIAKGGIITSLPVKEVTLHYTADSGEQMDKYSWQQIPCDLRDYNWTANIPADATMWYISTTTANGIRASSRLHLK